MVYVALGAAAVFGALTTCVLFPSLSDLTSGDAATEDVLVPPDAFSSDVSVDGGGFDGLADVALVDASYCSQSDATFCDDFDTTSLAVDWGSLFAYPGSTIDIDPCDAAPSPPNTLLGVIPGVDGGGREAYLNRGFTGSFTHFELSFALRMEQVDTGNPYGSLLPFNVWTYDDAGPGYHSVQLYLYATAAHMYEVDVFPDGGGGAQQFPNFFQAPVVGTWSKFDMAIDLKPDGGPASLTVTLDSVVVRNDTLLPGWTLGQKMLLQFGMYYPYGTVTPWKLRFDNVEVRAW